MGRLYFSKAVKARSSSRSAVSGVIKDHRRDRDFFKHVALGGKIPNHVMEEGGCAPVSANPGEPDSSTTGDRSA